MVCSCGSRSTYGFLAEIEVVVGINGLLVTAS